MNSRMRLYNKSQWFIVLQSVCSDCGKKQSQEYGNVKGQCDSANVFKPSQTIFNHTTASLQVIAPRHKGNMKGAQETAE